MSTRFFQTVFTPAVKAVQTFYGSREPYARHDESPTEPDRLTIQEGAFISERDSFYLATVTESGWPYVQFRGGAPGFMKVLDERTLGFADFRGNRQYVSVGNLSANNRAAFFFMDYPNRTRLKLLGRLNVVAVDSAPELAGRLIHPDYKAKVERLITVEVEAFDWNCAQHITPRFTIEDIAPSLEKLKARIAELEAALAART
jgi:predicted pyridoxine 5'-phosphate oxidase superfamily flavin-nucleotide-binding protein